MVHAFGILPFSNNDLLIIIGGILLLLSLFFGFIRKSWTVPETIITLFLLVLFVATLITVPLHEEGGIEVPDEPIYQTIEIKASIKPWVFNITSINDEPVSASKYEAVSAGVGYVETVVYSTIELEVGRVYKLIFESLDTDHGAKVEDLKDYWGEELRFPLPQQTPVVVYVKPTETGTYSYFCNFFCGAGHGNMKAEIVVS